MTTTPLSDTHLQVEALARVRVRIVQLTSAHDVRLGTEPDLWLLIGELSAAARDPLDLRNSSPLRDALGHLSDARRIELLSALLRLMELRPALEADGFGDVESELALAVLRDVLAGAAFELEFAGDPAAQVNVVVLQEMLPGRNEDLARICGVSDEQWARWRGGETPSLEHAARLHALATTCKLLKRAWTDEGVVRWWARAHPGISHATPQSILDHDPAHALECLRPLLEMR